MPIFGRKLIPMDEEGKQQPIPKGPEVEKGDLVKDKITGFTGLVICILDYLHGCKRLAIKSKDLKDGLPMDEQYCDENQVEIIEKGHYFKEPEPIKVKAPGGDQYIHDPGREVHMNLKSY